MVASLIHRLKIPISSHSGVGIVNVEGFSLFVEAFLPDNDTNAEEAEDNNTNDNPDNNTSVFNGENSECTVALSFELKAETSNVSSFNFFGVSPDNFNGVSEWDNNFVCGSNREYFEACSVV